MADEVVDAVVDTSVDVTPVEAAVETAVTPEADEFTPFEQALGELDTADEVTPVATDAAPAIPEHFNAALQISPYVTSPEHLANAVSAADEVWKVAQGQMPAYSMLEAVKTHDPQRYEAMVGELTQYIEQVTGKKFGADGQQVDPVAQLRNELQQERLQQQQARQQYEFQQQMNKASAVTTDLAAKLLKDSILDGEHEYIISQAHRFSKVSAEQLLKEVVSGDTKNLEAALKAAQKAETARIKKVNDNIIKQHRAKKGALPASKGNSASALPMGSDKADLSTPEARIKWATEQFKTKAV